MRNPICFWLLLLVFSPIGFAQTSGLSAAVARLPPCAQLCLKSGLAESLCDPTDAKCICLDTQLQSSVEVCVLSTCSTRNALATKNATTTLCGAPIRNRQGSLRATNITLGVISAVCVLLRIVHRAKYSAGELGWDDYMILATLISGVPQTIITDKGTIASGLGRDIWTIPFDNVITFTRWFYVMEVLYFLVLSLLKLSLLFFFLRIFPGREIRHFIWGTIAFDIVFGIAFVTAAIFQCNPVSYYWTRFDGTHHGKCININGLGWANAAISIALDLWMLGLPLSQVFSLKLAWKKKVSVALMFFVGTFVTVVSIIRLQSLIHFANSTNPTWDQVDVSNWSTIEINVGIMCACMPALRVILVHAFPKLMGTTRTPTNQYYAHTPSKSGNISSAVGSRMGRDHHGGSGLHGSARRDKNGITYTKSFEVTHGMGGGDDEEQLVRMDDLSSKGRKVGSSGSSVVSVNGAISPLPLPTSPAPARI
ncbi:hypothetical protein K458DRAFT_343059 [Lentithecium fluviatile CBS 122367]|uniref:CFEM domain-containing protein n=1 Tax=Lentithecium fluviatile CBS 122367 TaxID=1168545 RepID=A0A6G1IVT0_9PLEO|nr:hypothetical protein K458DRAFT_343059 [Lentithecium fluviatile CBS 122367]